MFFHLVMSGLSNGSMYAIVALGLVLIFKATSVINFAHGESFMIGGFLCFTFYVMLGVHYIASTILAVVLSFFLGVLTERVAYRPIIRSPILSLVLATTGISFILKGIARFIWGGKGEFITFPPIFTFKPVVLAGIVLSPQHIIILLVALVYISFFAFVFQKTKLGKMMRATAENQRAASLVGIRIETIFSITWGIGAATGAIAGVLSVPFTLLYPDLGAGLLVKAFAAAVLGGMDSLLGAILAALCISLVENFVGFYISSSLLELSPFLFIIFGLIVRPAGLLGSKEIIRV